jgi:hypothetical protein
MFRMMLLGACLIYGLIIAWLCNNGENFNQLWIWSSFIIFVINNEVANGLLVKIGLFEGEDEEDNE